MTTAPEALSPTGTSTSPTPDPQLAQPAPPRAAGKVTAPGPRVLPPTPSPATGSQPLGGPGSPSAAGPLPPDPLEANGDTPSSPDPGPDAATSTLNVGKRPLKEVLRGLVLAGTVAIHRALARTELEQQQHLWLMTTEAEAAPIADPLANIAGRRAGAAVVNSDTADLISAGVATAAYVISNVIRTFEVRRAQRTMLRAGVNPAGEHPREDTQQ